MSLGAPVMSLGAPVMSLGKLLDQLFDAGK
jgi:hypothetical protein